MNILITGGAGFLGLHLAKAFSKERYEVYLLDIAPFDKAEYPANCHFITADVRDKTLMDKHLREMDFVVHAAAALPLWSTADILSTNIDGTKNILSAAQKNKVKRLIYISSTAVYGVPIKHPILETDPLVGVGPYGQSKIDAEKHCRMFMKKGLPITILRPKTFLGTHRLGVFEILFDWIHDGKKIPTVGSGNNKYQLLEVSDLAEAVVLFTKKNTAAYTDVFNIAAEKYNTVKQDFDTMFVAINSRSRVFPTPAGVVKKTLWLLEKLRLSPLYQWVYDTADKDSYASIEKLTKVLKWHPRHSNSEALTKAYKWYYKNYKDIKSRGSGVTHTVGWKQGILGLVKKFM